MKRFVIGFGWLVAACVAVAGTGTSNEFRLDTRTGVRTAAATEKIQYSTAWATNLTAAQQGEAKAVVKVNPCLKTPPKYLVVDMSGGRSAARWPISYLDEVPSGGWTDEYKTEKLVLRYIPAGSFIMGGRATDYPGAVNTNLHMVTLTKPFYIGVFECTQRQWELAMGTRPSCFTNEACYATRPVEFVSYEDIRGAEKGTRWPEGRDVDEESFFYMMRAKSMLYGFDLPTEAQWEYACRAGVATALNSGKNVTDMDECPNADEVGRYTGNSNPYVAGLSAFAKRGTDLSSGTMSVGMYLPNLFGLYDMHGNVWEHCLDSTELSTSGVVDPCGGPMPSQYHQVRGGSWVNHPYEIISGDHHVYMEVGHLQSSRESFVGFRICLHNATVYPSTDSATVLVNAAGAGAADWTPTQAGTYQLTHEVQVDGTTVAPMESALFKVEGPVLNIRPQGELTNGVEVAIEGAGDWPVYYTTDGTTPTAGSTKYEGPFALPESATVKAVAISAGGVSSEVASKELTLHPALAVEDTKARQRYPWNGKVDIDCEITGDATKKYAVTFSVEDEVGHTNLPIRTVGRAGSMNPPDGDGGFIETALPFVLGPGKYRFVWDAAADLPKGTRFGGVSVSIDAEPSPMADWKRMVTISTDGYAGNETLTDVPVLVRLSSAIEGFDYADFAAPDTGADMIFTDMEGTARYPYEIDEWHKDGESLVWVKLPELKKGTKFLLAYGNAETGNREQGIGNREDRKHEVWREYAGVWHMNEDSGTAFDSTEHGLDALPSNGSNDNARAQMEMVSCDNGACGKSRVNGRAKIRPGNFMTIPSYDALALNSRFVFSGWFSGEGYVIGTTVTRFASRKSSNEDEGWETACYEYDYVPNVLSGGASGSANTHVVRFVSNLTNQDYVNVTYAYYDDIVTIYTNGCQAAVGMIDAAVDNGKPLLLGSSFGGGGPSFNGQYDEIRLCGGSLSADRIKADYDMIANRDFCTYGKVEAGPGADPVPPSVHSAVVTFNPNGGTLIGQSPEIYKGDSVAFGTMPTATKGGYSFRGWGRTADATEVVKSTDLVPASGCELFALWDAMTYAVKFNASGGTGTMLDEVFAIGVAKALTANAFTRDGYAFEGWATSAGGTKVYSDKQSVSDLTTPGATVNLYAVWKSLGGVQLWENGPYWAECNVGATKPEESGYYFWWGDTVGYKRNGSKWDAADGSKTGFSFTQENCPTEGMDNAQLQDAGYVDWNGQESLYGGAGNLVVAHDAATTHLGAPWRMPTDEEIFALESRCDSEWTKLNGVFGRMVRGQGAYSSNQIFLPAAGYGSGSDIQYSFLNNSKCGHYWSSTAAWDYAPGDAMLLFFDSFGVGEAYDDSGHFAGRYGQVPRGLGCTIRPVR